MAPRVIFRKNRGNCWPVFAQRFESYIESRLQTVSGKKIGVKRYTTEIVVDMGGTMQILMAVVIMKVAVVLQQHRVNHSLNRNSSKRRKHNSVLHQALSMMHNRHRTTR